MNALLRKNIGPVYYEYYGKNMIRGESRKRSMCYAENTLLLHRINVCTDNT